MIPETNHMVDDLEPYQSWQIDRFGNIITYSGELITKEESEQREQQSEAERIDRYFENILNDHWNY